MDIPAVGQSNDHPTLATETRYPAEKGTSQGVTVVPAGDISPLLALPTEMLTHIVNFLSNRDVMMINDTCRYLRGVAAPILTARSRLWCQQFGPAQQQQFTQITKNISQHGLRAWLLQFTRDEVLISKLCYQLDQEVTSNVLARNKARNPEHTTMFPQQFPQHLFYLMSQLMNDSRLLHPVPVSDIKCHYHVATSATLSNDARYLATNCYGSADWGAKIHVLGAENVGNLQTSHKGWVRQVILSADNQHLLSLSADQTVKITSLTGNHRWEQQLVIVHDDEIRSATFSPDSCHAVTASGDQSAQVASVDQNGHWALTARIVHDDDVRSANFSPDSRLIVTASEDGTVKIHERADNGTWLPKATLPHTGKVISAEFSPDGKHIITVSVNGNNNGPGQKATIYSVNSDGHWTAKAVITHSARICSATFSPDSRHAVTASRNHTVTILHCDTNGKWQQKTVIKHTNRVTSASFSPNSLLLITASDCSAKIYELDADSSSWSKQRSIAHQYKISSAQFSPDNRHILTLSSNDTASSCADYHARIHSRDTSGQWLQSKHIKPESGVYSGQFNHDGSHVMITDCEGRALVLGREADGKWSHKALLEHSYSLASAEFSANSSHIVTISRDGKRIKVWRLNGEDAAPPSTSKRKAPPVLAASPCKMARRPARR